MAKDIVCNSCGLVNDYSVKPKSNQRCAYCNGCGRFIQNVPYTTPKFYIGKYKGKEVSEVGDLSYLTWYLENVRTTPAIKQAIINRKNEITESGR
jgi:hypothetical protein